MRRLILAGLPLALVISASAMAVGVFTNDYNGNIKGDPYPGSSIGFDIKHTASHHRRVTGFNASGIVFHCSGGDPGETTLTTIDGSFRVHRNGIFGGKAHATIEAVDPRAVLTGKLRHDGSAVGTLRLHGTLDPVDQPGVNCDTGTKDYKAEKGPRPLRQP
jgi:hypothetical protein